MKRQQTKDNRQQQLTSKVVGRRKVSIAYNDRSKSFSLRTVADWSRVVTWLLPRLCAGTVLALAGPLGAGKTTCVQYLAQAFGIRKTLPSPTFSLLRTYRLPKPVNNITRLIHVDAYRIEDERDLLPLDLDAELRDGKTLLVLEWPENVRRWLKAQRCSIMLTIRVD